MSDKNDALGRCLIIGVFGIFFGWHTIHSPIQTEKKFSHSSGLYVKTEKTIFGSNVTDKCKLSDFRDLRITEWVSEKSGNKSSSFSLQADVAGRKEPLEIDFALKAEDLPYSKFKSFLDNAKSEDYIDRTREDWLSVQLGFGYLLTGMFFAGCLIVNFIPASAFRRRKNLGPISFGQQQEFLLEILEAVSVDSSVDQELFLREYFRYIGLCMNMQLTRFLSHFAKREATKSEQVFVLFEIYIYLFFQTDIIAFNKKQPDRTRGKLTAMFEDVMEEMFYSKDRNLEPVAQNRLAEYTKVYREATATWNPEQLLLNQIALVVEEQSISTELKIALYGMMAKAIDYMVICEGTHAITIHRTAMINLFKAENSLEDLKPIRVTNLIIDGIRSARPLRLSSPEVNKETTKDLSGVK